MRIPRIYTDQSLPEVLTESLDMELSGSAANHVGRVLRMTEGRELKVFNGRQPGHFQAVITAVSKKHVGIRLTEFKASHNESPLHIELGQAISKGDRMDFTIQKAVELGVSSITPLWTTRCDVKLSGDRLEKKHQHWQQVAISACEQSGRDYVPAIQTPQKLEQWLGFVKQDIRWVLDPRGNVEKTGDGKIESASLLVGPEGGLSEDEIQLAIDKQFCAKLIGPRVLRTETAALTAITLLQAQFGDF